MPGPQEVDEETRERPIRPSDVRTDDAIDEQTTERKPRPGRPAKPKPEPVVEADPVVEAEAVVEPEPVVEPDAVPEPGPAAEPEPQPEPVVEAAPEVEEEASTESGEAPAEPPISPEPPTALGTARTALAGLGAWSKRAAAVTGERVGTFTKQTSETLRTRAEEAARRRAEARERAETERAEREAARELAAIESAAAIAEPIEHTVEFELVPAVDPTEHVLSVHGLTKAFDDKVAVDGIDLQVHPGDFYGIVGPNGAGKTTTLSMITGLLRPDAGTVFVHGADVWNDPVTAKRHMGVLPDRLRLFDRLTGAQLLFYAGVLRGLDAATVKRRTADLCRAFGLEEALPRLVSDYSAGMTKKIALAAAMIHSPRLLVLDEPFESVDPVSAANVTSILKQYVAAGGTVVLSSHSMDLVQRICDHVAVVVGGVLLADGTMDEVRAGRTLEERFVELAGGRTSVEGLEWLHSFSD